LFTFWPPAPDALQNDREAAGKSAVSTHVHQVDRSLHLVYIVATSTRRTAYQQSSSSRNVNACASGRPQSQPCLHCGHQHQTHCVSTEQQQQERQCMCIRSTAVSTLFTLAASTRRTAQPNIDQQENQRQCMCMRQCKKTDRWCAAQTTLLT
jgi:hypothetical protein